MMNYLGYLRKRNPAGTPRRTLSHFLVCDSDKKKNALASTFSDLFFAHPCRISSLPRGNGKNCAASPRLFFLFGCPIFPMLAHGVLGIVPRLRRSLPRRAKRRNKSVLARERHSRKQNNPTGTRRFLGVPASPEPRRGGTISPRERSARTSFRRASAVPIRADAFPRIRSRKKKERPAPACAAVGGNASFCAGFQCARAASRAAFFLSHLRTGSGIVPPSS